MIKRFYHNANMLQRCTQLVKRLESLGFSKENALCALCATGFRSLRDAQLWLCLHTDDPIINFQTEQDFFLLLCPPEDIQSILINFHFELKKLLGWSTALDFPPCLFLLHFEVSVQDIPMLHAVTHELLPVYNNDGKEYIFPFVMDLRSDPNTMSYIPSNENIGAVLDHYCATFLENASRAGLKLRVLPKSNKRHAYHLPIAHAFPDDLLNALKQLNDVFLTPEVCNEVQPWSICLYSRDPRLHIPDPEVYEMITMVESGDGSHLPDLSSVDSLPNRDSAPNNHLGKSVNAVDSSFPTSTSDQSLSNANAACESIENSNQQEHNTSSVTAEHSVAVNGKSIHRPILLHQPGDFVLLVDSYSLPGRQGFPVGTNLMTGCTGLFNMNAGRRVPQHFTWLQQCSSQVKLNVTFFSHEPVMGPVKSLQIQKSWLHLTGNDGMNEPARQRHFSQESETSSKMSRFRSSQLQRDKSGQFSSASNPSMTNSSSTPSSTNSNLRSNHSVCDPDSDGVACLQFSPTVSVGATVSSNCNTFVPHSGPPTTLITQKSDHSTSGRVAAISAVNADVAPQKSRSGFFRASRYPCRQLFVMRHAERVDICFGRAWITQCFDKRGVYRRLNLNLPPWLPPRPDHLDYALDSPITQVGLFVAAETGRALADSGVKFTACYSSPSLRCVQTASELLCAMGRSDLLVRVEPCLFEWLGWYTTCVPRMLSPDDLRASGYPVDTNYQPLSSTASFNTSESIQNYYERCGSLTKRLLALHKAKDSCILIVAHASSLDTCTNQLINYGFRPRISNDEFLHRTSGVPYCGLVVLQQQRRWSFVDPPIPNVCSYSHNTDFDWKRLLGPTLCGIGFR